MTMGAEVREGELKMSHCRLCGQRGWAQDKGCGWPPGAAEARKGGPLEASRGNKAL